MGRINDTVTYPNTTPALTDHVIGTDVSNTATSGDGEVVTFLLGDILTLGSPLIENRTVAGTEEDFTSFDSSKYNAYTFVFQNVVIDNGVSLLCRLSSDTGTTFISTTSYYTNSGTAASSAAIFDTYTTSALFSGCGISGRVTLYKPEITNDTCFDSDLSGATVGPSFTRSTGAHALNSTSAIDAIRFYPSSGSFSSGTISMYGWRKT